jgi:hypothetical protein
LLKISFYLNRMILQILQLTVLDIATHRIGNPSSILTADLNENDNTTVSTTKDVLQPKVTGKYQLALRIIFFIPVRFEMKSSFRQHV